MEWWKNGKEHRNEKGEDGYLLPAVESGGNKAWWKKGKIHRYETDQYGYYLPAYIYDGRHEWWVKGEQRFDLATIEEIPGWMFNPEVLREE